MTLFDVLRFVIFTTFGLGVGFMLITNVIAYQVLRPPRELGFLWWHVTGISLSFLCLGVVAVDRAVSKLGDPPTWRTFVTLAGCLLFAVAQTIIFNVERQRLVQARALARAGSDLRDAER